MATGDHDIYSIPTGCVGTDSGIVWTDPTPKASTSRFMVPLTPKGSESMKELNKSITKTIDEVPDLRKEAENKFGGFNYVSIDEYYKEVAAIAAKNGISWSCVEVSCEQFGNAVNSKGKETPVFRFTYKFNVMHGEEQFGDFTRFSIIHPFQGPQTAGSAASYAEKLFMRTTFKVVTGEGDADAVDTTIELTAEKPRSKGYAEMEKLIREESDLTKLVLEYRSKADKIKKLTVADKKDIDNLYTARVRELSSEASLSL